VNNQGRRFMFDYIPEFFRAETATDEAEADRWYDDKKNNRRTPDLLPRDEVARAIVAEVRAGRGTAAGGVYLDIASRRSADYIKRRLPSMYQQFKELADVDITTTSMEVGPTLHYLMGGVRVDADTAATTVPGLFAAGEVAAGLHGANRLGGNSLSDLLVFGRRAGLAAAEHAMSGGQAPSLDGAQVEQAERQMRAPLERESGEDPYAVHEELRERMQDLVGIIRAGSELEEALGHIERLRERADAVKAVGGRRYNPGWNLALDLRPMLLCGEATARSALRRTESRGGHTRSDFPRADAAWGTKNVVTRLRAGRIQLAEGPLTPMPPELAELVGEEPSPEPVRVPEQEPV
jgi:succinate dehydrogenase / fumarate reductase flavoprotein subunit